MAFAPSIKLTTPQKEQSPVAVQRGLPNNHRYRPAPRFVYVHYPTNWEFDLVEGFVPRLSKIVAKPGVNGVGENLSLTGTLAHLSAKGATYIDPKDIRLEDYQDYVRYYECDGGAKWYVDFCDEATVLPNGELLWNTTEVGPSFRAFQAKIRDSGMIEEMHYEVYQKFLARERRRNDSLLGRAERNPHLLKRAERSQQRMEAMEVWWDNQRDNLAAKVKAHRTTKKTLKTPVFEEEV